MEGESLCGKVPEISVSPNRKGTSENITCPGFGKVVQFIAMQMDPSTVQQLETCFEFQPFERCQTNDQCYNLTFVRHLESKGHIGPKGISPLEKALLEIDKQGVAERITACFEEFLKQGATFDKQTVDGEHQQESASDQSPDNTEKSRSSMKRDLQALSANEVGDTSEGSMAATSTEICNQRHIELQVVLKKMGLEIGSDYYVYIHKLLNMKERQPRNDGTTMIGTAIDLTQKKPNLLFLTKRARTLHKLKDDTFYRILHAIQLPLNKDNHEAILLGTESHISILSKKLFTGFKLDDLKSEASKFFRELAGAELQALDHQLINPDHDDVFSCSGHIALAGTPEFYAACQNPDCYRIPLDVQTNGLFFCPNCEKTFFPSEVNQEARMNICIEEKEGSYLHCMMYKDVMLSVLEHLNLSHRHMRRLHEVLYEKDVCASLKYISNSDYIIMCMEVKRW